MKNIKKEYFGKTKEGQVVNRYTLTNDGGMQVSVIDYGCRINKLLVPDKNGRMINVVLGFQTMDKYEGEGCYGALIGRFANQIRNGRFMLCGKEYQLVCNNPPHYIHGNYEYVIFHTEAYDDRLEFSYESPDGEFGFPGNMSIKAVYTLTEDGALELEYEAVTDKTTIINITNHSYFNLNGLPDDWAADGIRKIYNHTLRLFADTYLENDDECIVTGKIIPVEGDFHDHRVEKLIEEKPYDHNYCFGRAGEMKEMAVLKCGDTGIKMTCFSTQPGIQVFTGSGKAVALETQHYPDSPNHAEWPSVILYPGDLYKEKTVYRFDNV